MIAAIPIPVPAQITIAISQPITAASGNAMAGARKPPKNPDAVCTENALPMCRSPTDALKIA